ncbi:helix-turn-helix domain-containing protein [Stenotrophomonas sp. CFBP8994]|uniref:helix-turn-helix domain-containing protein n=1 Tax=Stenotrophomonas sp. CFBP8994 TaxID=3096527 RepID=UPI002A69A981|nr:helix-turn-helix domain-containing protein [Stenotrophomonas sp. CFBP8994]MDY0978955.1 helix-turn-helix domain-containing protein [Stenotrophomonas sp. CFBP8994]
MTRTPTKHEVRTALGFENDADLAELFGISRAAVAQWSKDKPIPELRWLQLQLLRPEIQIGSGHDRP